MTRAKKIPSNFRLSPTAREQLLWLADHRGITMGAVVEMLIRQDYADEARKARADQAEQHNAFLQHEN